MSIVDATHRLIRSRPLAFRCEEIGLAAFGWNIANRDLTAALSARVSAEPLIRRLEAPVDEVVCDAGQVTLRTGLETVDARLVVAADGRESACRTAAGIEARRWSYPQTALTVNLAHQRPHNDVSTEFHTESGPFTLVPLPGHRSSLVCVVAPAEAERLRGMDDAALALALERRSHSLFGRLTIEGPRSFWPLSGLSAKRLAGNRVALIGETAHMFPPIGAQGFNLTVRDILALADTIADAADPGAAAVLARYEAARRGDVAMRTTAVDLLNRSLLSEFLPVQLARSAGLYLLERSAPIRRQAMRQGLAPQLES